MVEQLCVFKPMVEQKEEEILFFYPPNCRSFDQIRLIRLCQGLLAFTKVFSPAAPCEFIKLGLRSHIIYQCEENIWMVMVVENGKYHDEMAREMAMQAILQEVHGLFVMFYGKISSLVQMDPFGGLVRNCLNAFIPDYLSDCVAGKKVNMPSIHDSLSERGTIQMLSLNAETALEVQCIANLLGSWFVNGRSHTLILYKNFLVSTTLPPEDAIYLYTYANMRLSPSSTKPICEEGRGFQPSSTTRQGTLSMRDGMGRRSLSLLRPLKHKGWWRDEDGFVVTDTWGGEEVPRVILRDSEEPMSLFVYQQKMLTLLLLVPLEESTLLRSRILNEASLMVVELEKKLAKEWSAAHDYHVPGYRYLCIDRRIDQDFSVSQSSPPSKVATLSEGSFSVLNRVRGEVDLAKKRYERRNLTQPWDFEISMRAKNNAWAIVRVNGAKELYMVLERASDTLLVTCEAIEMFNKRYCNGTFSSN